MKQTVRIKFLDSNSKEVIRKRLEDACQKIADEYEAHPELDTPVLQVGQYPNGEWDTKVSEGMTKVKKANLLNYTDEDGKLNFEQLLKEFYEFLNTKKTANVELETEHHEIADEVDLKDEEDDTEEPVEETGEEVEENTDSEEDSEDDEDVEDDSEDVEEEITYKEYLEKELKNIEKDDPRYYLIKIALKKAKGWAYLKDPEDLEGNDFDIVTPKNAKKVIKTLKGK